MNADYPWSASTLKAVARLRNLRREVAKRRSAPASKSELQNADRAAAETELAALEAWLALRPGRELLDAIDSLDLLR